MGLDFEFGMVVAVALCTKVSWPAGFKSCDVTKDFGWK